MTRLLTLTLALGCAGCTRGVRVEGVTFGPRDRGHLQVVAKLDTDLRDLEYFIRFDYAIRDDADPSEPPTRGVEYRGRYCGTRSLERAVSEGWGGARSEAGDPFRVRIHVPWPVEPDGRRFLVLRLRGVAPYFCWAVESNTVVAEIPPANR